MRFKGEGKTSVMKDLGALLYLNKNPTRPRGFPAYLSLQYLFFYLLFFPKRIRKQGRELNNVPSNATCYQALNDTRESIWEEC